MTRICTMGPTPPAKGEAVVARSRGRSAHATRKRTRAAATRNLPMLPNPTKFSLTPGHAAITKGQTANDQSEAHVLFRSGKKRSEEHTSELQSLMRISYAVFCLKKK